MSKCLKIIVSTMLKMLYIKKKQFTSTRLKSLKIYSAYPSDKFIFTSRGPDFIW